MTRSASSSPAIHDKREWHLDGSRAVGSSSLTHSSSLGWHSFVYVDGQHVQRVTHAIGQTRPSCKSIPSPTGTLTSTQTRFGFPDESITVSCANDNDAKIQYSLRFLCLTVQEALLEGPEVIERLADRDRFEAGVEPDREKRS